MWKGGAKVLGFPTVCVVGFIPHLMVVAGIAICGAIYLLAAIFSAFAPPRREGLEGVPGERDNDLFAPRAQLDGGADDPPTHRWFPDFSNLQANITLSTLTISWSEDFYTSLLKLGFQCLTAASEATYLNEGAPLRVPGLTWLERERIRVLERQRKWAVEKKALGDSWVGDAEVAMLIGADNKKGYGNEKKEIKSWMVGLSGGYVVSAGGEGEAANGGDMANERSRERRRRKLGSGRGKMWVGAVEFVRGVVGVVGRWAVRGMVGLGKKIGVVSGEEQGERDGGDVGEEPVEQEDGENEFDEASMQILGERWVDGERHEEDRRRLYQAFLQARRLLPEEEDDDSGEYTPRLSSDDEDSLSTITTTTTSYSSSLSLSTSPPYSYRSGSVTPTPETPCPPPRRRQPHIHRRTMGLPMDSVLDDDNEDSDGDDDTGTPQLLHLAALLDPQTPEQRSMARIMSHHLAAPKGKYVTRRSAVTTNATITNNRNSNHNTTPATTFEELTLEGLILEKRRGGGGDGEGGEGGMEGEAWGPCVVCQTNPRTVVVWPCRCLALCEECRVSLAMRNFATCVCCRREVGGVSRVFAV